MMQVKIKTLCLVVALLCGATAARSAGLVRIAHADNGIVAVDNTSPAAGDVVTITVKPDEGFGIRKADITVEATIDPGAAQVPALGAPVVGYFVPVEGDEPTDVTVETTYTFIMPESPLNVLITAEFKQSSSDTAVRDIATSATVVKVSYVDLAGRVSSAPHPGLNLVVSTLADGTRTVTRMIK